MRFQKFIIMTIPCRIWSVGARRQFLTLEMTDKATGQLDRGQWDEVQERDYGTGCALLVPREVFEKVGLFDERYFAYYEDLDFSFRVKEAGFRMILVPEARLWHKVARTSGGLDHRWNVISWPREACCFLAGTEGAGVAFLLFPIAWEAPLRPQLSCCSVENSSRSQAYWKGLSEGLKLVFRDHRSEFKSG